ncbi:MAG: threonine synthase [Euryarchaeota archaeon]|nr:threonine synthase [Euryarchaeota archaeon]
MDGLQCRECGKVFSLDKKIWRCVCGGLLDIKFTPHFPLNTIEKRKPTIWRYREALPVRDDSIISFGEGCTPMIKETIGGVSLWLKEDQLFPTGSFKDRGASVLISKLKELGIQRVVEDSSGNAGAAIAAYCAKAEIKCDIFVPKEVSSAKMHQTESYGAELHRVPGDREEAAKAALSAAEETYYASHSRNPFFFHGTKTFAFEVSEQLGWKAPDTVVLPVGNGTVLLGAYIGFNELLNAGVTERVPRIIAVQSENCSPLYRAFKDVPAVKKKETIAEGIAIAHPIRGKQILSAVRKTGGDFIAVSDSEIKDSLSEMWKKGHFIEPTAAATIAGLKKYLKKSSDELVVSVLTGHGLKMGG